MYLHLGSNLVVPRGEIIGIFDLDKTTVSARTRQFLTAKEKQGKVISPDSLPQSFIVSAGKAGECIYLSPLSSGTLAKRKDLTEEEKHNEAEPFGNNV